MSRVSSVLLRHPEWPRRILVYRVVNGVTQGLLFECCMNAFGISPRCSACSHCTALVGRERQPCPQRACLDAEYCLSHLRQFYHVLIQPSGIAEGGLGLFAARRRPLRVGSNGRPLPVFVPGEFIAPYGGVHLTPQQFDALYDFEHAGQHYESTGPYAVQADDGHIIDGLCLRRVGAYANDYRGSAASGPNAELQEDGLWALHNIFPGDEILVDYGQAYWAAQNHLRVVQTPVAPQRAVPTSTGIRGRIRRHTH